MSSFDPSRRELLAAAAVGPFAPIERGAPASDLSSAASQAGSLNVKSFGAVGDGVQDDTQPLAKAIAALSEHKTSHNSLYFPGGTYRTTQGVFLRLNNVAPVHLYSDSKATLVADIPDNHWLIDVDYAQDATADFLQFNMTNISLSDIQNTRRKNGLRLQRVIGARFTQCEFNFLKTGVDMGNDSNLNTFDTCMWRGNEHGWRSSSGISNNNIFLNCQWRYHAGTAFDSTGTVGNTIIGGDFEPGNASPVIVASNLRARDVRFERNRVNDRPVITVLNDNCLEAASYCDGGTAAVPFFDVQGNNNLLKVYGNGGVAAIVRKGALRNCVEIPYFHTLVTSGTAIYLCEDGEASNVLKAGTSVQANGTSVGMIEAYRNELVSADLTKWIARECSVTRRGLGYRVTITGNDPALTTSPSSGHYSNIKIACTSTHSDPSSQAIMTISGGPSTHFALGNGSPGYDGRRLLSTFQDAVYTNPTFTIKPERVVVGSFFEIYFLRTSQIYSPE